MFFVFAEFDLEGGQVTRVLEEADIVPVVGLLGAHDEADLRENIVRVNDHEIQQPRLSLIIDSMKTAAKRNKEDNKISEDTDYDKCMDMDRYHRHLPAIYNQYFETNLLAIIDRLPRQEHKVKPQSTKIGFSVSKDKEVKGASGGEELQDVVLAHKHDCDGLGNDIRINQYQILKLLLGKGSHSFVKLAKKNDKNYAIKTISMDRIKKKYYIKEEQIVKMINCETSLLRKLKSPNIIGFEEVIHSPDKERVFIVLEYCSKGSLLKIINKSLDISIKQWEIIVGKYFVQMVRGLKYMHDNNVIHRDMKTENVLVNDKDEVKIIDFNVSMIVPPSGDVTITSKFVGTKTYAPPELVIPTSQSRVMDGRLIDVWALGVTFLQLLLRRHPFDVSSMETLVSSMQKPPQISKSFDKDLQNLIMSMLSQQNKDRPNTNQILNNPWVRRMQQKLK